jgi:hypothetical protein
MAVEFHFDVVPDEHGVFDGRELAEQMIDLAYRALVPYVYACPGCSDTLFAAVANRAIARLHCEDLGDHPSYLYATVTGKAGCDAEIAHLKASTQRTLRLLREGDPAHCSADH